MKPRRLLAFAAAPLIAIGVLAGCTSSPSTPAAPAVAASHLATKAAGKAQNTPATTLGIWLNAEDGGTYSTVSGQTPNVAPYYLAWGQPYPTAFIQAAEAQGATPYLEIEPWHTGNNYNGAAPLFSNITNNNDSADTDCNPAGAGYTTSCATWLTDIGADIAAGAHPVIMTFAHEFNTSGQYPWSEGDTGSCGSTSCTPAQWIAAWDAVRAAINADASAYTYWMWAPNAYTGGSTELPAAWWPGASEVDMVGIDGYPSTMYGSQFGTFAGEFQPTFTNIQGLSGESTIANPDIFISETDFAPLDGSGYQTISAFMAADLAAGGDGVLIFEDGTPTMTSTQWTELDTALGSAPSPSPSPSQSPSPSPSPTSPSPTPSPSPSLPYTAAPSTAPTGLTAAQNGVLTLSWGAVAQATNYQVIVTEPDGQVWVSSIVTSTSATYDVLPYPGYYSFTVQAVNPDGNGPVSAVDSFSATG
jgi:hypothetical protein